jgi:hypothetical protein
VLPVTDPTSAVLSVIFRLYVAFGHPAWACVATLCALHFCFPTVLTRISACPSFSRDPTRGQRTPRRGCVATRFFFPDGAALVRGLNSPAARQAFGAPQNGPGRAADLESLIGSGRGFKSLGI